MELDSGVVRREACADCCDVSHFRKIFGRALRTQSRFLPRDANTAGGHCTRLVRSCLSPGNWIARLWPLYHLREAASHSDRLASRMRSSVNAYLTRPNSHPSAMWSRCFPPHSPAFHRKLLSNPQATKRSTAFVVTSGGLAWAEVSSR